jgi:hypothetical protein
MACTVDLGTISRHKDHEVGRDASGSVHYGVRFCKDWDTNGRGHDNTDADEEACSDV